MAEVSFGEWLKRRRNTMGLTQEQLARRIACSASALRKFEAELRRPSADVIERLAKIFNIPTHELPSFQRFARGDLYALANSDGEMDDTPWRVSRMAPRSNLPASITSFVGRQKEQEELIRILTKNRLVTLAGVGGIGKTRLAIQVGQRLLNQYPHGVWFIPLDSLSDPARVPQTIASVFDIHEGSSDKPLLERLTFSLHAKTILLILDNCEHLLDACARLSTALLQNCPNLKVLITSREILNVEGEATYYLSSLSIPDSGIPSEELTEYESVNLFNERAVLALASFKLTIENAGAIVDICHRLDGIPLSIELAASHVSFLSVKEILKQLNDSFSLLVSDRRTLLPRHQTLRASMDWSWGLLSQAEQIFLRQLSVFAGSWSLESAQAVCDGDVLSLTSALVKKSLIMVNQGSGREFRYRFHETVRQYAREKLVESGEEVNVRARHMKFFSQFAQQAETGLRGPVQGTWYVHVYDERDNIRAALEWADNTDIEVGLYISGRLGRYWEDFNFREGFHWIERFLQKTESKSYLPARAVALHAYARLLLWLQQFAKARVSAQECLEIQRTLGDRSGETDILLVLGNTLIFGGEFEAGLEFIQQAYELAQSLNDTWRRATALHFLGYYHPEHSSYWEEASVLFQQIGDWRSLGNILGQRASFSIRNGAVESAQNYLDQAAPLAEANKKLGMWINDEITKSMIALARGDYEKAYILVTQAVVRANELGHLMNYLWARVRFGYVVLRMGDLNEAQAAFAETARQFLSDQFDIGVVFALEGMAELYIAVGKHERAAWLVGWADATRKKISDTRPPLEQADVDKTIAACRAMMGDVAFADAYDAGQAMTPDEALTCAFGEKQT